eukprot:m.115908 g.115908  ORF g.115908 m.115908 type:complete len:217 (-) comp28462_c0_seq2:88-738(-)
MPKVISRSIVVTDTDNDAEAEQKKVQIYYCLCKKMLLVSSVALDTLSRRRVDNSLYFPSSVKFKLKSKDGPTVCIKRPGGKERQHRLLCPNCGLQTAYKGAKDSKDLYILNGALIKIDEDATVAPPGMGGGGQGQNQIMIQRNETQTGKKTSSVSVATTSHEEEMQLEARELGANYDANARVIQMLLEKKPPGQKRKETQGEETTQPKRRKGTLFN